MVVLVLLQKVTESDGLHLTVNCSHVEGFLRVIGHDAGSGTVFRLSGSPLELVFFHIIPSGEPAEYRVLTQA